MKLAIIAAVATHTHVIGKDGGMPWRLRSDLRRFMNLTMGSPLIMGRRTFESLGSKPLPGRLAIVVTSHPEALKQSGVIPCCSLEAAIKIASGRDPDYIMGGHSTTYVIGGTRIFEEALPLADLLYLTWVKGDIAGDTYFPKTNWDWRVVSIEDHPADDKNSHDTQFVVYEKFVPTNTLPPMRPRRGRRKPGVPSRDEMYQILKARSEELKQ